MKKILITLTLLFAFQISYSQAYHKGAKMLNLGVSTSIGYGLGVASSLDYGISDLLSAGVGLNYSTYNYGILSSKYKINYTNISVRVTAHAAKYLSELKISPEKLDIYGGLNPTYSMVKYQDGFLSSSYNGRASGVRIGVHFGARYYIKNKLAIYLEGNSIQSSAGVTLKF